jgi:septal ring factor EnvC (AmiA/AmiB activator)
MQHASQQLPFDDCFAVQRDLELRCHQLEQELRLSFDRIVHQERKFEHERTSLETQLEAERASLETCRRQLTARDSMSIGLRTLMAESRDICRESAACVDNLAGILSDLSLEQASEAHCKEQEHADLVHRSGLVSGEPAFAYTIDFRGALFSF